MATIEQVQRLRGALAAMDPSQFAALRASLEATRAAVDVRLAQLDAEREVLASRRARLDEALTKLAKPAALDQLRKTMLRVSDTAAPATKPRKPAKPAKPGRKPKKPGR